MKELTLDEGLVDELSQLLDIVPLQIKTIPIEEQRKPNLLIFPTNEDLWAILNRVYLLGNPD